jgi:predicted transcriptional regulator
MSSSSDEKEKDVCKELTTFLVSIGTLEQIDADLYALALGKGEITSKAVHIEFPKIAPNNAINYLKKLEDKGFLERSSKETRGKHPYTILFKPVHPKMALKKVLENLKSLPGVLGKFDEHWDHLVEGTKQNTEVLQATNERVGFAIGASIIRSAKREIKIYSHDCTWFHNYDLQESIEKALSNNVTVTVIAENPEQSLAKKIIDAHISLRSCGNSFGPPFCLVDEDWLFLPVKSGILSQRFSPIRTNDKYLIHNYRRLFDTILGYSVKWGKR